MNKETKMLLEKFQGVLSGSTSAKEQGVDVAPNDIDIFFVSWGQAIVALAYLIHCGWVPDIKSEPKRYNKRLVSWNKTVKKEGVVIDIVVPTTFPEFDPQTRFVTLRYLLQRHLERNGYASPAEGQNPHLLVEIDEYSRKLLEKIIS